MARRPKREVIRATRFTWIVYKVRDIYYADGRNLAVNGWKLGRNSLGTKDYQHAVTVKLPRLDCFMARKQDRALNPTSRQEAGGVLGLSDGIRLFLESKDKPGVMGGSRASTRKRYRGALDQFQAYADATAFITGTKSVATP